MSVLPIVIFKLTSALERLVCARKMLWQTVEKSMDGAKGQIWSAPTAAALLIFLVFLRRTDTKRCRAALATAFQMGFPRLLTESVSHPLTEFVTGLANFS